MNLNYKSLNKSDQKTVDKYLANWAILPQTLDEESFKQTYQNCLVIPLYRENDHIRGQIKSLKDISPASSLIIYVINQKSQSEEDLNDNKSTFDFLCSLGDSTKVSENITLVGGGSFDLLVIDKFTDPIPADEGVGLARKIGSDLALGLYKRGIIESGCFYSSDGDALFPEDYFEEHTALQKNISFALKNFSHDTSSLKSENEVKAMKSYEDYLKYFPEGLAFAGSKYAYHTVGSCFVVSFNGYAKVRGFPKKSAGEDFYIANKLRKIGEVHLSTLNPIMLEARSSTRVPFGTGPSIIEIAKIYDDNKEYLVHSPKSFIELKGVLDLAHSLLRGEKIVASSPEIKTVLESSGFFRQIGRSINSAKDQNTIDKSFHDWFDGLRQLQFLNEVSKTIHKKISIQESLKILSELLP